MHSIQGQQQQTTDASDSILKCPFSSSNSGESAVKNLNASTATTTTDNDSELKKDL